MPSWQSESAKPKLTAEGTIQSPLRPLSQQQEAHRTGAMTKPSKKLETTEERVKASKRGTWKPADPNAPVTVVVGWRPAKTEKTAEKEK